MRNHVRSVNLLMLFSSPSQPACAKAKSKASKVECLLHKCNRSRSMQTWTFSTRFRLHKNFFSLFSDENLCSHMMALGNLISIKNTLRIHALKITRKCSNTCCSLEKFATEKLSTSSFGFFQLMKFCGKFFPRLNLNFETKTTFFFSLSKEYFAESINSDIGFYGFRCESYFQYVFGWCNLKEKVRNKLGLDRVKMGEHCEQKWVWEVDFSQDFSSSSTRNSSIRWAGGTDALKVFSVIDFFFLPQSWRYRFCKYTQKGAICYGIIEFCNVR